MDIIDWYLDEIDRREADYWRSRREAEIMRVEPDWFDKQEYAEYFYQEWVLTLMWQEA